MRIRITLAALAVTATAALDAPRLAGASRRRPHRRERCSRHASDVRAPRRRYRSLRSRRATRPHPDDYGNLTVNNEPFSVVNPANPDLIISGWNDYCSDWMGLGFSTDGGDTWTNSLVPDIRPTRPPKGMASPEYLRTNTASDPVAVVQPRWQVLLLRRDLVRRVRRSQDQLRRLGRPLCGEVDRLTRCTRPTRSDYLDTTRVGRGPSAANFKGRFNDKEMIEVDRTGGATDGNVYMCWTKFPSNRLEPDLLQSVDQQRPRRSPRASRSAQPDLVRVATSPSSMMVMCTYCGATLSSPVRRRTTVSPPLVPSNGGTSFSAPTKVAALPQYTPFDGARDCGDGADACPAGFVFSRVPLEPRITADPTGRLPGVFAFAQQGDPATQVPSQSSYNTVGSPGQVSRGIVTMYRSLNDGVTWTGPYRVTSQAPRAPVLPGRRRERRTTGRHLAGQPS